MNNVSTIGNTANTAATVASNAVSNDNSNVNKTSVSGKTFGNPQLSEKAAKYYESLQKKYSGMDFVLVAKDQKEQAKAQAASFANKNKMVVLIDEEKIEKMATDENFRKQYEGIIAKGALGMSEMGDKLATSGANVKGYGMQINDDGTASYFAVLEKSSAAQKARIEKKAVEKRDAKRAEDKKAAKKEQQERLEKSRDKSGKVEKEEPETMTITASSMDELLQKVKDQAYYYMSDNVQTQAEKNVGQKFDFSV